MNVTLAIPLPSIVDALPRIAEAAPEIDRTGAFPRESIAELHRLGALAHQIPRHVGGTGGTLSDAARIVEQVGGACPSTALILAMQFVQTRTVMANPAVPRALKERIASDVLHGGALLNALRVEPALGTPARGGLPDTIARRVAEGWRLTGRKIYSTGAPGLAWFLVWARTDEAEPRVGPFLVPAGSPGITIVETWDHLGLRGSCSHDVVFRDTLIPAENGIDLRAPAAWATRDDEQTAWNALLIAALYTGVAQAAQSWIVRFLRERVPANLGAPLASLPRMQEAVGENEARLLANRRLIRGAASDTDAGSPPSGTESGLLKTIAADNAIAVVERAVALAGNHGLSRSNPLERHLRDVLCARIHTPQPDSAYGAAGRATLHA